MKNIFLLIILISGCKDSFGKKRCLKDVTEFTCSKNVKIFTSTINSEQNNHIDVCKERFNSLLFHYKSNSVSLTVMSKQHIGEILEVKADSCSSSTAKKHTICNYPGRNQPKIQFRCKSKDFVCEELSPQSYQVSNGEFTELIHEGLPHKYFYSCKMERRKAENLYDGFILTITDIVTFTKSPIIGENLDYFCKYDDKDQNLGKFVCKGEDPTNCDVVIHTKIADKKSRFTIENNKKGNITITMKDLRAIDSGTYWCGANTSNRQIFISRLFLNVVTTPTSPPTSSTSSGTSGGLSSEAKTSIIMTAVGGTLIILLIVTFSLYKRCLCSDKAENRSGEQHPTEDCIYEEIPDGLETKVGTVYATVNFSPNDPASLHYCTINFQSGSTKTADGEAQIMEPSSSSCQYSAIKLSQNSASLSGPPTKCTGEPLYSAVKK
ncbi:CMRF35-like molecule 8 [Poecilia reticulata]|uniref:CMRF35-like molecule 8 n=1 Tax=Poecilia reticulata TaxID=8081 RepID=UPI0007EBB2FC|nr:PREDICTED: CMRF35-like molecule 8 [Poecilia reticulata]